MSKVNFALGNKPKLVSCNNKIIRRFIPASCKAVLIISCDFELAWAWRFSKQINCDLKIAEQMAKKERESIPLILELCEKFNIPMAWAIVGHLFLKGCVKQKKAAHQDIPRLSHFENKYWKFDSGDWFDNDPCSNWQNFPAWYAPDLIEKITNSKVKHEIACHTFSHIDCRNEICPEDTLRRELQKWKDAASRYGIEPKSFIFPANLIGNLKILKEEGFTAYRADEDVLGFPKRDRYGLWQVPTTAEIALSSYNWSLDYHIKRYNIIIERAIKRGRLCHFWFHPSTEKEFLEKALEGLFTFIKMKRKDLYITTMREYIGFLENGKV